MGNHEELLRRGGRYYRLYVEGVREHGNDKEMCRINCA